MLDEVVCVSFRVNAFEKNMNLSLLFASCPVMNK